MVFTSNLLDDLLPLASDEVAILDEEEEIFVEEDTLDDDDTEDDSDFVMEIRESECD